MCRVSFLLLSTGRCRWWLLLLRDSNYVKAKPVLEDIELFDASFGFNPREAEITDHTPFLSVLGQPLKVLDNSETYAGSIGVYAGAGTSSGPNTYLLNNLIQTVSLENQLITNFYCK